MYERHSEKAENDHLINEFISLVDGTTTDGIISFANLTTQPFMKFWSNLIIYDHEADKNDLRVIYCGTRLADISGFEWTGKLISELDIGDHNTENIIKTNLEVLSKKMRNFVSGNVFWEKSDYTNWHQVKMPLRRKDQLNEVLCLWSIE